MIRNRGRVAVIAPTLALARSAAAFLAGCFSDALSPFALPDYLASPRAPRRIVLCPSGRSVASDVRFLKAARERILWDAPDEIVYSAIEGLLGSIPPAPAPGSGRRRAPVSRKRAGATAVALLLEGIVTSARALALSSDDARLWIVEHPGRVRVDRGLMETLRRKGVRWAALEPVSVLALVASPLLSRARSRWRRLLPPETLVWVSPVSRPTADGRKPRDATDSRRCRPV
jgi:hypothetical protein